MRAENPCALQQQAGETGFCGAQGKKEAGRTDNESLRRRGIPQSSFTFLSAAQDGTCRPSTDVRTHFTHTCLCVPFLLLFLVYESIFNLESILILPTSKLCQSHSLLDCLKIKVEVLVA